MKSWSERCRPLLRSGRETTPTHRVGLQRMATLALAAALLVSCNKPNAIPVEKVQLAPATSKEILAAVRNAGAPVVLVNVWASWCGPCREEFPDLVKLARNYQGKGLKVIFVSADFDSEADAAKKFLARQGVDWPTFHKAEKDEAFIEAFDKRWSGALPATFVYDGHGTLRHFLEGKNSYAMFEEKVLEVLNNPDSNSVQLNWRITMKRTLIVTSLLAAAVAVQAGQLKLGDPAPSASVKLKSHDGKEVSIADVKGTKGTLVVFSCNGCPYAKAWESRLVELGNAYSKKGVGAIMINSNQGDSLDAIQKRAKEKGFAFPYAADETSDVARAFGAQKTPEVFLFDASGKLVYHGTIDDDSQHPDKVEKHYLRDALDAVVAGKDVAVKETSAIGCGIKFRPKA